MNYKSKHKILKELKKHWDEGEEETKGGYTITSYGRSLTIIQLSKRVKLSSDKIQDLCDSLVSNDLIEIIKEDSESKSHSYIIKPIGKTYVTDKIYLNKVWFRNFDFWKFVLPFIIGLLGLLNSIFRWWSSD